jgi:hypothetical protein
MSGFDPNMIRMCVDRIHPRDLQRLDAASATRSDADAERMRMAILRGKKWDPGRRITVSFLDGPADVRRRVVDVARMWEEHANIELDFDDETEADIRISFEQIGSWSYLGTDSLGIRSDLPTMNYGWLTPEVSDREYERVVLHEFGHALGAIHEHQHPAAGIPWEVDVVYAYYMGPPNNWSRAQVDTNIFRRYAADITQHSEFDPDSIMLYAIPNDLTTGDWEVGWNATLSEIDKRFIAETYPGRRVPGAVRIEIGAPPVLASIAEIAEEDQYVFTADENRPYLIETEGFTDVVMELHGPDTRERMVAWNDDAGIGLNARIEAILEPGDYFITVRHYSPTRTGDYRVKVRPA